MSLKSLMIELIGQLGRLTTIGQIATLRTIMVVFLSQAKQPANEQLFQSDKRLLLQVAMPMADIIYESSRPTQNAEFTQNAYVASLATELLVVLHDIFKQELLEGLLECYTDLNPNDVSEYDRFCDRIELGMVPCLEMNSDTQEDFANFNQELKIPYLTKLLENEKSGKGN